ncbi:hypothetical protein [Nocardiopsis sp. CC223A]|uniref:hypothetical protein n=1 Tax=Nocardiopsis sp. CC223A TaxID=3044051 RepID=UPI00278C1440|nr:hypothetical protein [Nocardiopsis sp. CC223A]
MIDLNLDRLLAAEVTPEDLLALAGTGPGALIIPDTDSSGYTLARAEHLDWNRRRVVVYGYRDLALDLALRHRDHAEAAADLTRTVRAGLRGWAARTRKASPLVWRVREDLRLNGLYLNARPQFSTTEDGGARIDDTLTWREDRRIGFTLCTVQRQPHSLMAALDLYCGGHYVTGWCERITRTSGAPRFAGLAGERARLHLDLRD